LGEKDKVVYTTSTSSFTLLLGFDELPMELSQLLIVLDSGLRAFLRNLEELQSFGGQLPNPPPSQRPSPQSYKIVQETLYLSYHLVDHAKPPTFWLLELLYPRNFQIYNSFLDAAVPHLKTSQTVSALSDIDSL